MSKTETMRQLNAAATAQRLKQSGRNPAAGSPAAQSGSPALDRLSTAVQELREQLLSVQSQLASWSQVVSELMAAALRTARQQDAAQQTIETQALRQERAASVQEMDAVLTRLTPLTESLERTQQFLRLDGQEPEWVGARRWVLWKGILVGVVATVILGGGGMLLSSKMWAELQRERAERQLYQSAWKVLTAEEQAEMNARLKLPKQPTK